MARKKSGIKIKPSRQGSLRRRAKAKKGKNLSTSKLESMKKSRNANTRKKATFALNAKKWKHR